ncbi:MAG: CHASE domain-containing protein [Chloroflexota bacterium]
MQATAEGQLSKFRDRLAWLKPNQLYRLPIPWLLLLLSLAGTIFVWQQEEQLLQSRIQTQLDQGIRQAEQTIQNRIFLYEEVLYNTRGLFVANESLSYDAWHRYVDSLDMTQRYPGLEEMGYIARVERNNVERFTAEVQGLGLPDYQVRLGEDGNDEHFIAQYVVATGQQNIMPGDDLAQDFMLYSVAERAGDLDMTTISRKVGLGTESETLTNVDDATVFFFVPVYAPEAPDVVKGWIYAALQTQVLLQDVMSAETMGLYVEVYDGTTIEAENILFAQGMGEMTADEVVFAETRALDFNGRLWTLSFSMLPQFGVIIDQTQPVLVLITGVIFSLLVFGLTWTFFTARERAVILAEAMTSTLRENKERYRTLVENAPEAIVVIDVDESLIEDVNENAVQLFGLTRKQLLRTSLTALSPPAQADGHASLPLMADNLAKALSGEKVEFEWVYLNSQGDEFLCDVRMVSLPSKSRNLVRGSIIDITERERTKKAMEQAQKLESLGVLAGGVAHDFNNLLVAMLGHTSLAMMRLSPTNPAYDHIAQAVKAAERAADLTQQMLAYSGRGHFRMQPMNLNLLIEENLHLFTSAISKNITLEQRLAYALPRVDADLGQMQQVIMNLILNGADAIGSKQGVVRITTDLCTLDEPSQAFSQQLNMLEPGTYIRLEVQDNGAGMDEQTLSRIFDPFFTTKETGRGLGLAAVQGIVRGHKGGLSVTSRPGEGTIFSLLLPVSKSEIDDDFLLPLPEQVSVPEDSLVLVIDDEAAVRNIVTDILEMAGIHTMVAANGESGIALYEQHQDEIDLVLLDLSMPGINGHETFVRLQRIDPDVNVVLSSGYDETDATVQFVGHGLSGFIQKPYDPKFFLNTIKGHLAKVEQEKTADFMLEPML